MGPLDPCDAYSVLSPTAISRVEPARWSEQARSFLGADLSVEGDAAKELFDLAIAPRTGGMSTHVSVRTLPVADCPDVLAAANRGVDAIGGAGMDALVARTQRVWQVARATSGDRRAPLVAAALLASVLLGPIVPPDEITIYGVRGARVRLEKLGWF